MMSLTEMTEDESCQNIHYSAQEEWIDLRDCLTLQTQEEKVRRNFLWNLQITETHVFNWNCEICFISCTFKQFKVVSGLVTY